MDPQDWTYTLCRHCHGRIRPAAWADNGPQWSHDDGERACPIRLIAEPAA